MSRSQKAGFVCYVELYYDQPNKIIRILPNSVQNSKLTEALGFQKIRLTIITDYSCPDTIHMYKDIIYGSPRAISNLLKEYQRQGIKVFYE